MRNDVVEVAERFVQLQDVHVTQFDIVRFPRGRVSFLSTSA